MKILLDMNLSPDWVETLENEGIHAVHWSSLGDPKAIDEVIMEFARRNDYVVFTHDLDFGAMLALTQAESPSVIQVRTQNVLPNYLAKTFLAVWKQHQDSLEQGALIVFDEEKARVRILPLQKKID